LGKGLAPLGDFATRAPGERIVPTPLFDSDWYLRSYPDVRQSGFDPFLHFMSSGDRDGRSPGPWIRCGSRPPRSNRIGWIEARD
jgi:hypothetical protein